MNERQDDTTPAAPGSRRAPGSYYYDDATGYEVFDPEADEEVEGEPGGEPGGEPAPGARPESQGRRARRGPFSARASRP